MQVEEQTEFSSEKCRMQNIDNENIANYKKQAKTDTTAQNDGVAYTWRNFPH